MKFILSGLRGDSLTMGGVGLMNSWADHKFYYQFLG